MKTFLRSAALAAALIGASGARAFDLSEAHYYVQTSVKSWHFYPKPDHNNHQHMLNLEVIDRSDWLVGGAWLLNSFGQPSRYLYAGKLWRSELHDIPVYAKLTGGLLHGYKGEYRDQIPFNSRGVAPVLVPALGARFGNVGAELIVFGTRGAIATLGYEF